MQTFKEKMDQLVPTLIAEGAFSCAGIKVVGFNKDGSDREIYTNTWGAWEEDGHSRPVTSDTLFDCASITKLYTAAVLIDLHERGVLSLEDECSGYLPSFEASQLTISDLLTHKAEFGCYLSELRKEGRSSLEERILSLVPPPNRSATAKYQNITYLLLGKIIEAATEKTFPAVMRDFLSKYHLSGSEFPTDNGSRLSAPPTEILAKDTAWGQPHDETARMLGGIAGHAGLFVSTHGLSKFGLLWLNDELIRTEKVRGFVFHNHSVPASPQGIGWWLRFPGESTNTYPLFSHSGFTGGLLAVNVRTKIAIAFLCNRTLYGRENKKHQLIWRCIREFFGADPFSTGCLVEGAGRSW